MKHTKGPWFVKDNGGKGELVGVASEASSWFVAEEVLAADALLIAAAPELLEALTTLQAYCIESIHGSKLGNDIAAVIAKATGE